MPNMIEKIARSFFDSVHEHGVRDLGKSVFMTWEELSEKHKADYRDSAKKALQAMQGDLGHDITAALCKPGDSRWDAVNAWQVMIDAAIRN